MNYAPSFKGAERVVSPGEFRFSAIGLDHGHIFGMTNGLLEAGAEIAGVYDPDEKKVADYISRYPGARAMSKEEILSDSSISLIVSAIIPAKRADLGIECMERGKHFFADKPGMLKLEDIERVRKACERTGKKYMVYFSERLHVEAAVKLQELIDQGVLGDIVSVTILAPHRLNPSTRPGWFFSPDQNGAILQDIGSHQMEQLLSYTHSETAEVKYASSKNFCHPDYPEFQDYGHAVVETSSGASCYIRLDWFTPDGLSAWGDGRVFIVGTEATCEIRKYVNVAEDAAGDHLFLVDKDGEHHLEMNGKTGFPFFGQFILDCINGTENAMTEEHVLESMRLALTADRMARV